YFTTLFNYVNQNSFPTRRSSDLFWGNSHEFSNFAEVKKTHVFYELLLPTRMNICTTLATNMQQPTRASNPIQSKSKPEFAIASKDRKSTRLNSSHGSISYAVFCL